MCGVQYEHELARNVQLNVQLHFIHTGALPLTMGPYGDHMALQHQNLALQHQNLAAPGPMLPHDLVIGQIPVVGQYSAGASSSGGRSGQQYGGPSQNLGHPPGNHPQGGGGHLGQ
jgi:hypothetical protein